MFSSAFNPITLVEASTNVYNDLDAIVRKSNALYFNEALTFVLESQREFNAANKAFYKTVLESAGNEEVIHESFGDFFSKVREIIDKLLKFIKSLFERFLTQLNAFIKREKYLKDHADDFKKFSSIHEFKFTGYDFTFSSEIPSVNVLAEFTTGWVFSMDGNGTTIPHGEALKTSVQDLNRHLEDGDWYDNFRKEVLGADSPIYQSEYAEELFKVFRNDETSPEDFEVTSSIVTASYYRFTNHDKAVSSVRHTKSRIESEYNSVKKQVDKMISINYVGSKRQANVVNPSGGKDVQLLKGEDITNMDLFIKAKVNQIQQMSNIHAMAFAAKLDALNDCFRQDKNMLYRALSKIQGSIGKEA